MATAFLEGSRDFPADGPHVGGASRERRNENLGRTQPGSQIRHLPHLRRGRTPDLHGEAAPLVQEANAIGKAWLRSDLLPLEARPQAREFFRRSFDSRIETYRKVPDMAAVRQELARAVELQQKIWQLAISSSRSAGSTAAPVVLQPALNAMFDITTTRTEAARLRPPTVIFVMVGTLVFTMVLSATVYVIVDLEYPRIGLIRMTDSDQVLVELRKSMD